ncbi:MAG: TlpA family protein disulfide reductase [Acidobacteria bacterium]|nr:TlpA family protein disulfide reductase [Acidobacteriota bacterium]
MNVFVLASVLWLAQLQQQPTPLNTEISAEDDHLRAVMSETNGSAVEMLRAFELHLNKFPNSPRKLEIEKAAAKSAIDLKDDARTILWGERVLQSEADLQILDRVANALLSSSNITPDMAQRALKYAKQFEELVLQIDKERLANPKDAARRRDEVDRGLCRSLVFQSRALTVLGKHADAVVAARKAFDYSPSEVAAHQLGIALSKAGQPAEAAKAFADAMVVPDPRATDAERELDRKLMAENWTKSKGSEAGLGELLLPAYDRTSALVAEKRKVLRQMDPNRDASNPMEYTLSGVNGDKLDLKSLRGKVVVLDFWATWCGPCRGQYPLYEQVKARFKDRKDVVFLAINTDEDQGLVKPFLAEQKWNKSVYFEDGLSRALRVENIPTTMVFDKTGQLASRLNGYIPDRFVDMLSTRIEYALNGATPQAVRQ